MKRGAFLLALAAIGAALRAIAQTAARLPRIARLDSAGKVSSMSASHPNQGSFLTELRTLGYTEGKTATVDRWSGDGNLADFPALVQKLTATRPDLILTAGLTVTRAAGRQRDDLLLRADRPIE